MGYGSGNSAPGPSDGFALVRSVLYMAESWQGLCVRSQNQPFVYGDAGLSVEDARVNCAKLSLRGIVTAVLAEVLLPDVVTPVLESIQRYPLD